MKRPLSLTCEPLTIDLRTTFRIAHGASDQRHNVIAHLDEGLGEGAAVAYHGETQAGIMAIIEQVAGTLGDDPFLIEDIIGRLPSGSQAARAAIDIALHDLWGKQIGQPLYRLLGLNPEAAPPTSFTIGIDEPDLMAERARESGMDVIKIKLGGPTDLASVKAIRNATNARLIVDANAGWTREQAESLIPSLVEFGVEMVEQPLAKGDIEGFRELRKSLNSRHIRMPIFADESVKTARDVAAHAGAIDGIVLKLMKSGGIREALKVIHTARALDMKIMIGCMVETSVGVTAGAHLAPLCDLADLDAPLMIKNDPYVGVKYAGSRLVLPVTPGLGVVKRVHSREHLL